MSLVFDQIQQLRNSYKQRSRRFRRLGLSLLEAYIVQRRWDQARDLLTDLFKVDACLDDLDVPDKSGRVDLMLAKARVCLSNDENTEARQLLDKALGFTQSHSTFPEGSLYQGVIRLLFAVR